MNTHPNDNDHSVESDTQPCNLPALNIGSLEPTATYSTKPISGLAAQPSGDRTEDVVNQIDSLHELIGQELSNDNANSCLMLSNDCDVVIGGAGENVVKGCTDSDTVIFDGNFDDFVIRNLGDNRLEVIGPNGIDTIAAAQHLQFDDCVVDFDDLSKLQWGDHPNSSFLLHTNGSDETVITAAADGSVKVIGPEGIDFIASEMQRDAENDVVDLPSDDSHEDHVQSQDTCAQHETDAQEQMAMLNQLFDGKEEYAKSTADQNESVANPIDTTENIETLSKAIDRTLPETNYDVNKDATNCEPNELVDCDVNDEIASRDISASSDESYLSRPLPMLPCVDGEYTPKESVQNLNEPELKQPNDDEFKIDEFARSKVESDESNIENEALPTESLDLINDVLACNHETMRRTVISFAGLASQQSVTAMAKFIEQCNGDVVDLTSRKLGFQGDLVAGFCEVQITMPDLQRFEELIAKEHPGVDVSCFVADAQLNLQACDQIKSPIDN